MRLVQLSTDVEHIFRDRMEYLAGPKSEDCFLCKKEDLVLTESSSCLVMMNRFPYNSGHLIIAPHRHVAAPAELSREEMDGLWGLLTKSLSALEKAFAPEGFNVGFNLGSAAGAGVPGHLHLHVVPRWNGDTNFMPIVAGTKVLPETLEATYHRLRKEF